MIFREVTIGPCRLICADCMDVLPTLEKVDAVVTDPPYGVDFKGKATKHTQATKEFTGGYVGGDSGVGPEAVRVALNVSSRGVVFPGNRLMFKYPEPYDIGCVYCPSGAGLGRWGFVTMHPILFYGVGQPHARQGPSGFQSFATQPENGHPCPKPVAWMEWAVKKCRRESETILDPFMGSGTTGVACIQTERQFIGIEKEPKYFDIACQRIQRAWDLKCSELPFEKPTPLKQRELIAIEE